MTKVVLGLDLAGSVRRSTGFAVLNGRKFLSVGIVNDDEEILKLVNYYSPVIVAIDAPLTLPQGRKHIDEKNEVHFRECDVKLRKLGIRFFPITLGPMRVLTKRGMALRNKLAKKGINVIEAFPGGSYDKIGVNRKNVREILKEFKRMGYVFENREYTQDEVDGMCCAITGQMVVRKRAFVLDGKDGKIYLLSKDV